MKFLKSLYKIIGFFSLILAISGILFCLTDYEMEFPIDLLSIIALLFIGVAILMKSYQVHFKYSDITQAILSIVGIGLYISAKCLEYLPLFS